MIVFLFLINRADNQIGIQHILLCDFMLQLYFFLFKLLKNRLYQLSVNGCKKAVIRLGINTGSG